MTPQSEKGRKTIGALFSSIAPTYDFLNHLLSLGCDTQWRKQLVRGTILPANGIVLDLCTGTGDVALAILRERGDFQGEIVAIDFSAMMVDNARAKIAQLGPPYPRRVDFMMGDALDLQFPDDKFDAVTVAFGVRNFEQIWAGLNEIRRVLKPSGQVCILEFFGDGAENGLIQRYADLVVPAVGDLVSHTKAYSYLRRSSGEFFTRPEFENILKFVGFTDISWEPLTFGIAHIVRARKG